MPRIIPKKYASSHYAGKSVMENVGGVLRVCVKRGVNLAVRNFLSRSSDPYVVIEMLDQSRRTRIIRKNVNPEWNENFTLSIIGPNHPVKLIVYHHKSFFTDDRMGDVEFDIFPFVEVLKTNLTAIPNGTVIKRIQPSKHNFLAHESCITYVNGKLVQDMILTLQNVKCGQLEIQLHWVDLPAFEELRKIELAIRQLQDAKEATIPTKLSETNKLHFEELPNFKGFSCGDIVEWPSLEDVIVNGCPKLKKFGLGTIKESQLKRFILDKQEQVDIDTKIRHLFELSDQFSTIDKYFIQGNEELRETIDNIRPSHFINLLKLSIKCCDERVNNFLFILMKRAQKLQDISIEQCKTFKHLFDLNELTPDKDGYGKYFTQIKTLILTELHQLECIWNKDPVGIFGFGNLKMVHIKGCSSLNNLFSPSAAEKLTQLYELKLEECKMLEKVIHTGTIKTIKFPRLNKVEFKSLSKLIYFYLYPLEFPHLKALIIEKCPELKEFTTGFATTNASYITNHRSFSELNELKLDNCHKLVYAVSSRALQELRNLVKLIVSHCNTLKIIFNIHDKILHDPKLPHLLDELILIDLPKLTQVINKKDVSFCQRLQILQVKQCKSLTWLPGSLMLKNIEILDCEALKEIIIDDKDEVTRGKKIFSKLKFVCLENLTTLSTIFPFTSQFPSLEELKITNCPKLRTFVKESKGTNLAKSSASNIFFPQSLSLETLKVLYMKNQDIEKLWHNNCPSKSFCELEYLTLCNNNKLLNVISSNIIIRFNKLKKLALEQCEALIEIFDLQDDKPNSSIQEMLPQLRELALSKLRNFTCVWNKEPQVPFFPNLISLHIVHCGTIKSLFSFSSTKNLQNLKFLKFLKLCNCENVEEVISFDIRRDVTINFPKMECLVLKDLPKLLSFYQQNGTIHLPNIQIVRARNIPRMKTFSGGSVITPLLRSIHITFFRKLWLGNLNNTLSYISNNPGM